MPVEAKPLFRPEVLRSYLATFRFSEEVKAARGKLAKWAELLATGRADQFKETELLPEFLTDIFCRLLGYVSAVDDHSRHTFGREKHVVVDGKFADAVLGEFGPGGNRYIVAVEGKGPKDPLDRPFAGRKKSAVDQGLGYAVNLKCDWYIVTSMRQTRLYHKGSDQYTYERFGTEALAADEAMLRRFVFLLGAERVVPASGTCHLYDLLTASEKVGKDLTKEFYVRYADMREAAFERLCGANPNVPAQEVLASTQKILDRILFCAFCEDRGLLPAETISKAYQHADPYNPRPVWENFKGLFRSVNKGNATLGIPAYNGGLFADDPALDGLAVPDEVCRYFQDLAAYEYRPATEVADAGDGKLVDVDILGHIFEQSITDLERLRNELDGLEERQGPEQHASRRKKEGAFYTPAFITRYIVGQALGSVLDDRFSALRQRHADEATGTARRVLADPSAFDPATLNDPQRTALIRFYERWQDELAAVKVLDPSCGSGAFLIEAFEQLYQAYQRSNDRLEELRGDRTLFDLDRHILQNNLYGVDLNGEAVQIARLSLWIKTARKGKVLTSLDHTLRVGNSVVADPEVHPRAFDWRSSFPEVFDRGGFDIVVGNPPYVRQEWISPYKPYLQGAYRTYHGVADLYVYFYELGLRVLRPGGRLSFVVTNKWIKAAYGEPLRRFFAEEAWVESVVDFGHAKQIFEDADVFPSIIVARKPLPGPAPAMARACAIPREQVRISDLSTQIEAEGFELERSRLGRDAWSLEPKSVRDLYAKIRDAGENLMSFAGVKPLTGIKTAYNDAYLIDTRVRNRLIESDPKAADLIKPYLRGQDIDRWSLEWGGMWMIAMKSSGDFAWPWASEGENAEAVFRDEYSSIYFFMKGHEEALRKRQDQGRYWWELRSCAYWDTFSAAKLYFQLIQYYPCYALDTTGYLGNNKTAFIPTDDAYLLGVLCSPLMWWFNWRYLPHMKDEALAPNPNVVERCPIATPKDDQRRKMVEAVGRMVTIAALTSDTSNMMLDWLKVEHEIEKPSMRLRDVISLDADAFLTEIRKIRGKKKPLSLAALRSLREEHARTVVPAQTLSAEARSLERRISDLVNEVYGLTSNEVRLMWDTAPPRMPTSNKSTLNSSVDGP